MEIIVGFISVIIMLFLTGGISIKYTKNNESGNNAKSDVISLTKYDFEKDSRVKELYKYSEYYHKLNKERNYTSHLLYGECSFEEFKAVFDQHKNEIFNCWSTLFSDKANEFVRYSMNKKSKISYQGEVVFQNRAMIFPQKRDWDLVQKYLIYMWLENVHEEKVGLNTVDWSEIAGTKNNNVKDNIPVVSNKNANTNNPLFKTLPMYKSKLDAICTRYNTVKEGVKHPNIEIVKQSLEVMDRLINGLNPSTMTKEICDRMNKTLASLDGAVSDIEKYVLDEAIQNTISTLDIEGRTIERVRQMCG